MIPDLGPAFRSRQGVEEGKPRAVDPPLIESDGPQDPARQIRLQGQGLLTGETGVWFAVFQRDVAIVGLKKGLNQLQLPFFREMGFVGFLEHREEKRNSKEKMGCDLLNVTGIDARNPRRVDVVQKVTASPVDHLTVGAGGGRGKIVLFDEEDLQSPKGRVTGDPATVDSPADHDEIVHGEVSYHKDSPDATRRRLSRKDQMQGA